eukprot:4261098-Prymnesium_polylepis.1
MTTRRSLTSARPAPNIVRHTRGAIVPCLTTAEGKGVPHAPARQGRLPARVCEAVQDRVGGQLEPGRQRVRREGPDEQDARRRAGGARRVGRRRDARAVRPLRHRPCVGGVPGVTPTVCG